MHRKDTPKATSQTPKTQTKSAAELQTYRAEMAEKLNKYFVGEYLIPNADLPPHYLAANRGYNSQHEKVIEKIGGR